MPHRSTPERSPNVQQLLSRGLDHHRRGELAAAEQCYLQVLRQVPDDFEARYQLGMLRAQQGRLAEGLDLIAAALAPRADLPRPQLSLASS